VRAPRYHYAKILQIVGEVRPRVQLLGHGRELVVLALGETVAPGESHYELGTTVGVYNLLYVQLETDVFGYKFLENETASFVINLADERARVAAEVLRTISG
jgi:hypothetical protein